MSNQIPPIFYGIKKTPKNANFKDVPLHLVPQCDGLLSEDSPEPRLVYQVGCFVPA